MANCIHNAGMTFDEIFAEDEAQGGYTAPEVSKEEAEQAFDELFAETRAALNKMMEVRK